MMHILWTIIIGAIVGVIAKLIHPGKENMGFFATILLGIGGALVFTFLGRVIGLYREGESAGFIGGIIGAILLLVIYGFVSDRMKTSAT